VAAGVSLDGRPAMPEDAELIFYRQYLADKAGAVEDEVVGRHEQEPRSRIALREQVFLGVVQAVPPFPPRPCKRLHSKGILREEPFLGAAIVVRIVLDENLDLPAFLGIRVVDDRI